jgi:hypothetical protein
MMIPLYMSSTKSMIDMLAQLLFTTRIVSAPKVASNSSLLSVRMYRKGISILK